jgi:hypothetical protein
MNKLNIRLSKLTTSWDGILIALNATGGFATRGAVGYVISRACQKRGYRRCTFYSIDIERQKIILAGYNDGKGSRG